MRLIKLKIKNFRAISDEVEIRFESKKNRVNDILILVGANNSGKSSILWAYDYFVKNRVPTQEDFHGGNDNPIEIEAFLKVETKEDQETLQIQNFFGTSNDILQVKKIWAKNAKDKEPSELKWWEPSLKEWQTFSNKTKSKNFDKTISAAMPVPVWIEGLTTPDSVIDAIQKLIKQAVLDELTGSDEYTRAAAALGEFQELVQKHDYTKKVQTHINETIQKVFPDISLQIQNSGGNIDFTKSLQKQTDIQIQESGKPNLKIENQGHGVRRQFILSTYKNCAQVLAEATKQSKEKSLSLDSSKFNDCIRERQPKTKMLLIEEPELFLHPSAVRAVQKVLYELTEYSEYQVLCASHSPIMIDFSRKHSSIVRIATNTDACSKLYQVEDDVFEKGDKGWLRMLQDFDPHVCEAFFAEKVILVEGSTEAIVVRKLLEKLKKGDNNMVQEIHIVNCRGKATIPLFQKILTHFHIPHFVFHDLDYQYDESGKLLNSWIINERIWKAIQNAKHKKVNARRFIFDREFESANGYDPPSHQKPFKAYQKAESWVQNWDDDNVQAKPIIRYLKIILGLNVENMNEEFDQKWVEQREPKKTPENFEDEILQIDMFKEEDIY